MRPEPKPPGLSERLRRATFETAMQFYAVESTVWKLDLSEDELDVLFWDEVGRRVTSEDNAWLRAGDPPRRPAGVPGPARAEPSGDDGILR